MEHGCPTTKYTLSCPAAQVSRIVCRKSKASRRDKTKTAKVDLVVVRGKGKMEGDDEKDKGSGGGGGSDVV